MRPTPTRRSAAAPTDRNGIVLLAARSEESRPDRLLQVGGEEVAFEDRRELCLTEGAGEEDGGTEDEGFDGDEAAQRRNRALLAGPRSEERRVGKECRYRWAA